ncbi:beta-phosphoglucomutase [Dyadobacter fanqingshengii]|uniref:Beta-phosphoglucomutase n=1 Tax=Dyadobacter fanqingshengii TaxID=2906443 RepID=A0A9X1PGS9_9BACT|nr:beta-phosphoglucomutase [Dyadobacter fanqingshengii]MCF0043410.1 beta-phosphoglucomutase [Dyadobacter fanqingshengii]USJ35878.1 beta-phosphoglucomutase [Dyadobacter fanqingshengii]
MPSIEACLFDLDGVIVDTAKYHYIAWRQLANDLGFDLTHAQNELLKGISRMESLEIILAIGGVKLTDEEKLQRATEKNSRYLALCMQMTPADTLPGVRAFLDELKKGGIKIGLGSASKNAKVILERIDMLSYFETIVDGNRITIGKPDPQVFLMGAADLAALPAQCVVFEDALAGIQSAKAAGMLAVGIGEKAVLTQADIVIPGFADFHFQDMEAAFA